MKIHGDDQIDSIPSTEYAPGFTGLTKLEYFSSLFMQARLASSKDIGYDTKGGNAVATKELAQQSVHDAVALIDALNQYHNIQESGKIKKTYVLEGKDAQRVANILGITESDLRREEPNEPLEPLDENIGNR